MMKEFLENIIKSLESYVDHPENYDSQEIYEIIQPIYEEAKELYKSPDVN